MDLAPTQWSHQWSNLDDTACRLEATGDYKILRRLVPRPAMGVPAGYTGKRGVIIDLETTGLDFAKAEVIELAMVKFCYSANDEVISIAETFQSFNQPSCPIPPEITELTGITDAMVQGRSIDAAAVETFVADANVVIVHNAAFDRKFAERYWPVFAEKPWACSMTEIDWRQYGFGGTKLGYLLTDAGYFHAAHRAVDDCQAVLELLARPLPTTSTSALAMLLDRARRDTVRIWAKNSPYDRKDVLKSRGYRWSDGADRRARCWYVDVDETRRDAEIDFLRTEIYQRAVDIECRRLTARERFSTRAQGVTLTAPPRSGPGLLVLCGNGDL